MNKNKSTVIEVHQDGPTLASKVEHGPDGVDEAALAQADAHAAAGLLYAFLAEADQDLNAIEHHCRTAAAQPVAERAAAIRELFAVAHGLRGQGGSFGFPMVTAIAASLNRFIEAQARFDEPEMAAIRGHVAALRRVLDARMSGDGGPTGQRLLDELAHLSAQG
jgi:chemotaxis protein histidine kinase CheA